MLEVRCTMLEVRCTMLDRTCGVLYETACRCRGRATLVSSPGALLLRGSLWDVMDLSASNFGFPATGRADPPYRMQRSRSTDDHEGL